MKTCVDLRDIFCRVVNGDIPNPVENIGVRTFIRVDTITIEKERLILKFRGNTMFNLDLNGSFSAFTSDTLSIKIGQDILVEVEPV